MKPNIIKKSFKLVGIETQIDFSTDFSTTISRLQEEFLSKLDNIKDAVTPNRYITFWYYKHDEEMCNNEPSCYCVAAVECSDIKNTYKDFIVKELPESLYAAFQEEKRGDIGGHEGYAYKKWLPKSGYKINEAICGDLEVYYDMKNIGPSSPCEILIPIKSLD